MRLSVVLTDPNAPVACLGLLCHAGRDREVD